MKYLNSKEVSNGNYRYELSRVWDLKKEPIVVIMCNPSSEHTEKDDSIIRKLTMILDEHGYGEMVIVNFFAYKSLYPGLLTNIEEKEAIGPYNDYFIDGILRNELDVLVAWGNFGKRYEKREKEILSKIKGLKVFCLGKNKNGTPKHPVSISYGTKLVPYFEKEKITKEQTNEKTCIKI